MEVIAVGAFADDIDMAFCSQKAEVGEEFLFAKVASVLGVFDDFWFIEQIDFEGEVSDAALFAKPNSFLFFCQREKGGAQGDGEDFFFEDGECDGEEEG